MALRRYHCGKCRRAFQAEKPACDQCGLDATKNPQFARVIVPVVTMHYEPPSPAYGIGTGEWACRPGVPHGGRQHTTGEPQHVNCEACKATPAWRNAMAAHDETSMHPDYDHLVNLEPPGR